MPRTGLLAHCVGWFEQLSRHEAIFGER